jgi:cytochrome P450
MQNSRKPHFTSNATRQSSNPSHLPIHRQVNLMWKWYYTKAVVNESLRLFPPAFLISRTAAGHDRLGNVDVRRGDLVMIAPWVLHRHAHLWKDPDAFNPSRFLGESPLAHRYAYMPFGAGPRICIGAPFALAEVCLGLATLIQRFEVTLANGSGVADGADHHAAGPRRAGKE